MVNKRQTRKKQANQLCWNWPWSSTKQGKQLLCNWSAFYLAATLPWLNSPLILGWFELSPIQWRTPHGCVTLFAVTTKDLQHPEEPEMDRRKGRQREKRDWSGGNGMRYFCVIICNFTSRTVSMVTVVPVPGNVVPYRGWIVRTYVPHSPPRHRCQPRDMWCQEIERVCRSCLQLALSCLF